MSKCKKSDNCYEYLKKAIISGAMSPMQLIDDEQIQKELNVSRTPVREAVLKLTSEGFIEILPNRGTLVAPLSLDLLKHLYTMRRLNEPYICYLASRNTPLAELRRLYDDLNDKYHTLPKEQLQEHMKIDCELHWRFLKACNNPFMQRAMSNVYDHIDRTRYLLQDPFTNDHAKEHMAILQSMLCDEREGIEQASLKHIVNSESRALRLALTI